MLVHHYFPRDVRVRREARALAAVGIEVTVIALRRPGEPARERWRDIEVVRLPVRRHRGSPLMVYLAEYAAFAAAAGLCLRSLGRFDVLHVHTPPDFLAAATLAERARGARLVLDIHDLTPELYGVRFRGAGGRIARALLARVEQRACRAADRVLTVTEAFRRLLVARGAEADRVRVVHNCPDEEIFELDRLRAEAPAEPRSGFRLVHHGTLVERYGLMTLLEAFARVVERLPGAHLDIYGEGDLAPRLARRAAEPPLAGRVRLWGDRPQEEVARAVAAADLCVVPSLDDPFTDLLLPTKLLEALCLGRPAVASATSGIREAVGDGARLVPPGDAEALAAAILELAAEPRERAALGARGRKAAERFSWRLEKLKLLDVYRELGARRPFDPPALPG
jgi:glycosyltransferase involved in cell wall biosynthesis